MSLTAADIIAITTAGNCVTIGPDGSIVITPAAKGGRSEANRRNYESRKARLNPTDSVDSVLKPTESTESVAIQSPPSPPLPLSPKPPIPCTPTPEQAQGAGAHTREAGELFETEKPPVETEKPHKRIRWSPGTGWTGILPDDKAAWAAAFPACDLDRQLSTADLWLRANPAKSRKQNFFRFLTNWLERKQERGGDAQSAPAAPKPRQAPPGDPCPVNVRVLTLDDLEALNNQSRPAHANR